MFPFFQGYDENKLGRSLKDWSYSPPRWKKVLGNLIPALGAAAVGLASIPAVSQRVPAEAQLALLGTFVAAMMYSMRWRGNLTYTLFQNGLTIKQSAGWNRQRVRMILWKDLENCSYDEDSVKLNPRSGLQVAVSLYCDGNRMEVYSLCRERIDAFRFGDKQYKVSEAFGKGGRSITEGRKSAFKVLRPDR